MSCKASRTASRRDEHENNRRQARRVRPRGTIQIAISTPEIKTNGQPMKIGSLSNAASAPTWPVLPASVVAAARIDTWDQEIKRLRIAAADAIEAIPAIETWQSPLCAKTTHDEANVLRRGKEIEFEPAMRRARRAIRTAHDGAIVREDLDAQIGARLALDALGAFWATL